MTTLILDTEEFPNFKGQQVGRELELEMRVVVMKVEAEPIDTSEIGRRVTLPGRITVEMLPLEIDITQTT